MNIYALWPEKIDEKKNKAKIFWCVKRTLFCFIKIQLKQITLKLNLTTLPKENLWLK